MVYYFRQMKEFQNEELKKAKHYISGQRELKISRLRFLKNKRQSAVAYLLLRYGLRKEYGINENVVLSEGSCGKPYLSNYPFVHFNLSHCDKGVACMISDSAVGIDITSVKKENMSCMYSSMTADEIEKILHAENPAVQFTKFWSLKESYCKCIGMGIDSYIKAIDFSNCIGSVFTRYGKMFQVNEVEGSVLIVWDFIKKIYPETMVEENSTNDFVTKVWGNILTKEIITKSVVPDLLKSIDLKQIKILDYAQELCPPDVKGQVYVSESEIMNDRNKTYYKILEHPLYGRMADTGIIGVLTHDGYMEFVVPNCETSVETPDKKEDTHEEEIEKPIVKEIMKIWKEVFEIEDISIQDDFYTLGGDSIILMRLVDEMCKTLGCDVTVDDILQSENISDLANRV